MMKETTGLEVSKVDREKLVACMTCPLCNKLFKDATTISECLHSFCRKCIYEKLTKENLGNCPVCKIDLGCAPLEKLRADNNWQDIRTKIFPSKRKQSNEPESTFLVALPAARRREKSLSSLGVTTPEEVSAKSYLTGRRSKLTARKTTGNRDSLYLSQQHFSKPDNRLQQQNVSLGESSKQQHLPDRNTKSVALEEKADLWKPLNRLVEAATNKTKPNKVNSQEANLPAIKECGDGSNVPGKQNDLTLEPSTSVRPSKETESTIPEPSTSVRPSKETDSTVPEPSTSVRPRRSRRRKGSLPERCNIPAQVVVDASQKIDGRFNPIWFSLVASQSQEGYAPLPQISSCYLRVKDGNLPVSSIKKYIATKLGLSSETEVEISLRGQPMLSTVQLHNLVEWWVQTTPTSERIQSYVGSSAKDFVMVLSYSRKAMPP
ncbi:Zinc finger, RING-type [Corchorus olitorius]|uniref:Zinc finger, RING-type n=1 Tax=Corchorus olitorius TaxID=93759 RepID=A0A1R3JLA1_9ROSI|nr:Zinc finger, RING-type [Corchorus olitorius]